MAKEPAKKTKKPTAQKRDIQNAKRRMLNRSFKAKVRTAVRDFEGAIEKQNSTEMLDALKQVHSLMDKGVKRGVFSLNKASRTKSRLAHRLSPSA